MESNQTVPIEQKDEFEYDLPQEWDYDTGFEYETDELK